MIVNWRVVGVCECYFSKVMKYVFILTAVKILDVINALGKLGKSLDKK